MYSGLSIFDLDHTLLTVNSSYYFGKFLYKKQYLSSFNFYYCLINYAQHKLFGLSIERLHQKVFAHLFKGIAQKSIEQMAHLFLLQNLAEILYHPVLQRLNQARQEGQYVAILSSSPDFLVKPVADQLRAHEWQATKYDQDGEGNFNRILQIVEGQNKADRACALAEKLNIPRELISVYSDSYLDLPVLKMAGRAIGVRPDNRLRRICLINGWEIL